jgi:hypothetical protein
MMPIITSAGVSFTFNDGDVDEVRSVISSELDHEAMPMMEANAALLFDFSGVKKIISVNGVLTDTGENVLSSGSAITINEQREWLEKIINGNQSGITFQSTYTSTYNGSSFVNSKCMKSTITFNERAGLPNRLSFNITLFVGDT